MRNLIIGAVAALALAVLANPVRAQTYASTVSFSGGSLIVTWTGLDLAVCDVFDLSNAVVAKPVVATIDGVDRAALASNAFTDNVATLTVTFTGTAAPLSVGTVSRLTLDGSTEIACGTYILQLPAGAAAPAPVPTLSEWAMILLGVLLAGGAALTIHRRRTA